MGINITKITEEIIIKINFIMIEEIIMVDSTKKGLTDLILID
jgi:hypothetical protein